MWYRIAREKFLYSPATRAKFTAPFAEENDPDKLEEIDLSENPELLPPDSTPQEQVPQVPEAQIPIAEGEDQSPILIDYNDPPLQSDNINKPSALPPPNAPHDGCRCTSRIREKISGGYEWKVDSGMCPDCMAAAQEYNRQSMDAAGVNNPIQL
jgi:hypothetical protein